MSKIVYVTMQWPVSSETFAARDVRALKELGNDIQIIALKPASSNNNALMQSFGIMDVSSFSPTFKDILRGIGLMCCYPVLLIYLLTLLYKSEKRFKVIYRSLVLMPSSFWAWYKIKNINPEVVHLFWGHYPSLVGLLVNRSMPQKKITMFLGAYDLHLQYGLSKILAQKADAVFTHVEINRQALMAMHVPESKIKVIYRGIDIQVNEALLKIKGKILFVGRLLKEKGIFELINVFRYLYEKNNHLHLTIAGSGKDQQILEDYIQTQNLVEAITITGWLTPQEVAKHMAEAQIFLLFSHSERLPNVIKEAMFFGAVPVTTRTAGIEELVDDQENGVIVDSTDAATIALTIEPLLANDALIQKMAAAGKYKILEKFDVQQNMRQYKAVWNCIDKSDGQGMVDIIHE